MLEVDLLGRQENTREPITRPKLKRLIFEYLHQRSRRDLIEESFIGHDEGAEGYAND